MSLENKDSSSVIKSSKSDTSFSLYSTPIEEIVAQRMKDGIEADAEVACRIHIDPVRRLVSPNKAG